MRIPYKASAFNLGLAAVVAAAAGFALFAMPDAMFARLGGAIGTSILVEGAGPFGIDPRVGAGAIAGAASFLLVWLLLRACDRPVRRKPRAEAPLDPDWIALRVRRADAHPDAPVRRPILAGRDLGEPGESEALASGPSPEPVRVPDHANDPAPTRAVDMPLQEPAVGPVDQYWSAGDEPSADPAPLDLVGFEASGEAEPVEVQGDPSEPDRPAAGDETEEWIGIDDLMARLPLPEDRGGSVSGLLRQLDARLAGAEWPLPEGADPQPQIQDDRLRSALDELRKMASRTGN